MGKGLDRRTFVRGAAGAVGMGAVGTLSSKLPYAAAQEAAQEAEQEAERQPLPASIDVWLDDVAAEHGRDQRWKIVCEDEVAAANSDVEWKAGPNVARILAVSFKGRSPFRHRGKDLQVLQPDGPGTTGTGTEGSPLKATTSANAAIGTYSYTIVVMATGGPEDAGGPAGAVQAKDPDLDII